jgi:hypothetical protein
LPTWAKSRSGWIRHPNCVYLRALIRINRVSHHSRAHETTQQGDFFPHETEIA